MNSFTRPQIPYKKLLKIVAFLFPLVLSANPVKLSSQLISYTACTKCGACTGLFLDERTVLTAAHCKEELESKEIHYDGLKISIENMSSSPVRKHLIKKHQYTLYPHPRYNPKTRANDIMIIRLNHNVVQLKKFTPISLSSLDHSLKEGSIWSIGFGDDRTEKSREVPLKFKKIELDMRLHFEHTGENGTCIGDSGGPSYLKRPGGSVELIGISSGVILSPRKRKCSSQNTSVHTWIYPHLDWVKGFLTNQPDSD